MVYIRSSCLLSFPSILDVLLNYCISIYSVLGIYLYLGSYYCFDYCILPVLSLFLYLYILYAMSEDFESLPPAVRRKVRVAHFLPSSLDSHRHTLGLLISLPPIAPSTEDHLNPIRPDSPVFSIFPFSLSALTL